MQMKELIYKYEHESPSIMISDALLAAGSCSNNLCCHQVRTSP